MKNNKALYFTSMILGIAILLMGIFVLRGEAVKSYAGVCTGFGAGMAAVAITRLVTISKMQKDPAFKRQVEIDAKDERTARINDLARSKAFRVMEIALGLLAITYILLDVSLLVILLLVGVYIAGWAAYFVYLGKYAKEM